MFLQGNVSQRFREKHLCDICETIMTTYKPKCYIPNDCDVEFTCLACHNQFCCECVTDEHILWGRKTKEDEGKVTS